MSPSIGLVPKKSDRGYLFICRNKEGEKRGPRNKCDNECLDVDPSGLAGRAENEKCRSHVPRNRRISQLVREAPSLEKRRIKSRETGEWMD